MDQNNNNNQPITSPTTPMAQPGVTPLPTPEPVTTTPAEQPLVTPPPTPAEQPATPPPPTGLTSSPTSHSKLLIIGIIILILVLGGLSYVLFLNSSKTPATSTTSTPTLAPTQAITPTATPTPDLKSQAEEIDTGNPETDLTEIQTDVQGL